MKKDANEIHAEFNDYIRKNYRYCRSVEEQAKDLAEYKQNGSVAARDSFVNAQICWVAYLMRSVYGPSDALLDLIQTGVLYLLDLVEKYDVDNPQKASFRTYARVSLLRRANKALEEMTDGLAVKSYVRRQSRFARMTYNGLRAEGEGEREALEETALRFYRRFSKHDYAAMPPYKQEKAMERVRNLLLLGKEAVSLDAPLSDDDAGGDAHIDNIVDGDLGPEEQYVREETVNALYAAIESDVLDERDRFILEHYFRLHEAEAMTLTAIAVKVGVSRQRVSAILGEIRTKLRKALGVEVA